MREWLFNFAWCWWVSCGVAKVQFWRRILPLGAPKTHEKSGACPRCATRAGLLRPAWLREAGCFLADPPPAVAAAVGRRILKKNIKNHQKSCLAHCKPGCEHPRARAPHRTVALQLAAGGALVSVLIFKKPLFMEMHGKCISAYVQRLIAKSLRPGSALSGNLPYYMPLHNIPTCRLSSYHDARAAVPPITFCAVLRHCWGVGCFISHRSNLR